MAKRPEARPATCRELTDAARASLGVAPSETSPPGAERRPPVRRPRSALVIAGGVILAVLFAVAILVARSRGGSGIALTHTPPVRPVDRVVQIDPSTGKI